MFLRGSSIDLIIASNRFYLGILFVSSFMVFNPRLKLQNWHIILLSFMSVYEFLSLNILGSNPIFYRFLSWDSSFILSRSHIGGGIYRAIGPALNSSVSGSIYAIFFWYFLNCRNFKLKQTKDYLTATTLGMAFLFCGSATAAMTFIILAVLLFISKYVHSQEIKITPKFIFLVSFSSLLGLILFWQFSDFFQFFQQKKLSYEYLEFIFELKSKDLGLAFTDYFSVIFGADLSETVPTSLGSDFALLNIIVINGLLPVIFLIGLIYNITPKKNRVFLIAAIISSMHYGTMFSLTGQIVFAALITNKINLESALRPKGRLKSSKLQI